SSKHGGSKALIHCYQKVMRRTI
ncbi:5'-3' exonuclease, N-terminal resolvase-like domain protein, partial [Vibrio parahaemolyticus V-223/04]